MRGFTPTQLLVFLCIITFLEATLAMEDMDRISVSLQTGVFWAVPFWIAYQEKFFEELGLDVAYEIFSSGAPQIVAGVEDKSWDVGAAGCVPNVIGALQGIHVIAISNDESAISALVGNQEGVAEWHSGNGNMKNADVSVTPNSTVHYAALKCLEQYPNNNGTINTFNLIFEPQSIVLQSLTAKDDDTGSTKVNFGALWPPDLYNFLDTVEGSEILCSGEQAGATIPGGIMVREEFGKEKPEVVARFLAGWLRGIGFLLNNEKREQSEMYLHEYNEYTIPGYRATVESIEKDFTLRPFFDLEKQLRIFDRSGGISEVDSWYQDVSQFLFDNKVINENPSVGSYISNEFLKMVQENETLRLFTKSSEGYSSPEGMETESNTSDGDSSSTEGRSKLGSCLVWLATLTIIFIQVG